MKKRYSIPLATFAGFVGLTIIGVGMVAHTTNSCAGGDFESCKDLVITHGPDFSDKDKIPKDLWDKAVKEVNWINTRIANQRDAAAKAKTEKTKKAQAKTKFVQQVDRAELECISGIKNRLNDPNSFQLLDYKHVFLDQEAYIFEVQFSAKNGFGGRVRNTATCKGRFS